MYETLEEPIEEGEEALEGFTQKEIAEMKTVDVKDLLNDITLVGKGDFAKIDGEFMPVDHIEWRDQKDCHVVTDDGGSYKLTRVRVFKKNPAQA